LIRFSGLIIILFYFQFGNSQNALERNALFYHQKADDSWQNLDTCLKYTLLAIPLLKEIKDWDRYVYNLNGLSYCFNQKSDFQSMLGNNELAYQEAKKYLSPNQTEFQESMNNLGLAFKLNERYDEALDIYFEGLKLSEKHIGDPRLIASFSENIANLYGLMAEYELSVQYSKKSLEYFDKLQNEQVKAVRKSKVLESIGFNSMNLGQHDQAEFYLRMAVKMSDLIKGANKVQHVSTRLGLVELLTKQERFEEALLHLEYVNEIANKNPLQQAYYFEAYAELNVKKGEPEEALKYYHKYLKVLPKELLIYRSENLRKVGELYAELGDETKFRNSFQESAQLLTYEMTDILYQEQYGWNQDFVKAINKLYAINPKPDLLLECIPKIEENLKLSPKALSALTTKKAINSFLKRLKSFNSSALNVVYQLNDSEGTSRFHGLAFDIIENGKSLLLASEVWQKMGNSNGEIQAAFLYEFKSNKVKQSQVSKAFTNYEAKDSLELKVWQDSLFSLQTERKQWQEKMRKEQPRYSRWLYNEPKRLSEISDQIKSEDITLVNYHYHDDVLYMVSFEKGRSQFVRSEVLQIEDQIAEWLSLMKTETQENLKDWETLGLELSTILLPKDLKTNQLIISPDGLLFEIPFAALPIFAGKDKRYLIEDYDVSNVYSFNTWSLLNSSQRKIKNSIIISDPDLNFDEKALQELRKELSSFTKTKESKNIKSSDSMIASLDGSQLIHISSHGVQYDSVYKEPILSFSNFKVGLSDFSYLDLDTEIISLSACETGLGENIIGEGTQSIMRQFKAQSVPTVLSTLWKVNANSTDQIFNSFYKNAGEGLNLSKALSEAQRSYLAAAPDFQKSPYYWAGIQLYGNIEPLVSRRRYWLYALLLFLFLVILFSFSKSISFKN